jgi:hypothetical protein
MVAVAARAERDSAPPDAQRDYAYLYLDDGMGCAIVSDGEVRRGAGGLAGEVAHLITVGPRGGAPHRRVRRSLVSGSPLPIPFALLTAARLSGQSPPRSASRGTRSGLSRWPP